MRFEMKEQLKAGIRTLKPREKLVLALRNLEGLAFWDIAKVMEMDRGECVVLHAMALRKVREHAEKARQDHEDAVAFVAAFDLDVMD